MSSHEHGHGGGQGNKIAEAMVHAAEGIVPDIMGMLLLVWLGASKPYQESGHGGYH